jgi:hypothetical protein
MRALYPTICVSLLMLLNQSAQAQRLSGKVVDAETGLPVSFASVSVLHTRVGTTSNAEGEFELPSSALPSKLVVSELSHRTDTVTVTSKGPLLQVRLRPAAVALPDVRPGAYTAELLRKAYRHLQHTNQATYGQAFYRQITRLDNEPTEVQEMVWHTKTSGIGLEATAPSQGRYAAKKALLNFKDFSRFSKSLSIASFSGDTANSKQVFGLNPTATCTLQLVGVTQVGDRELVEVGFAANNRPSEEYGSLLIDANTYQVLRYRLVTPYFNVKTNNPAFKLKQQNTTVEWVFQPKADGATVLNYLKIDYQGAMERPRKPDVNVQASSFTMFYDGQNSPAAGVAYLPFKSGSSDLKTIKDLPYDPAFWQNNSAVKRTPLEEATIKAFEQKGAFGTMLTP